VNVAVATIGHNRGPVPDPFDAFDTHLGDLFVESRNFLDGAGVNSEAEAEAVSKLLDLLRTASKDADKARAAEKKPHDDAGKVVQARWRPLIDRADMAIDTCKRVLGPWLQRKAAEQAALAEAARKEAETKAQAAAEAMRRADVTDLTAREGAEILVKEAAKAEAAAKLAESARPQATGGARATTLRIYYHPELVDAREALFHFAKTRPEAIKAALLELAEVEIRNGARSIPGFTIIAKQTVV
jgi:hypothetical protein